MSPDLLMLQSMSLRGQKTQAADLNELPSLSASRSLPAEDAAVHEIGDPFNLFFTLNLSFLLLSFKCPVIICCHCGVCP